ncbi:MAG TPA: cytochrome c1 [Stellaceae bacterium]|nr:cytochrome c1 [Stellaceae bacterium]
MMRKLLAAGLTAALLVGAASAYAQEEEALPHLDWSFYGIFGTYDRAAAQRGFQIYNEVCSNCHSLNLLTYGDLTDLGFTQDQVKAIAAAKQVPDTDDSGQPIQRPALPSDHFVAPFPNVKAARAANNGALPPDLSLIIKAREGGPDYVHGILTGYINPPAGFHLGDGMNYNEYFPGHQIAMPKPLSDKQVTYADGTPATVPQMAHDVTTFLAWASDPTLDQRHHIGFKVMLFLVVGVGVFYAAKRKTWSAIEH